MLPRTSSININDTHRLIPSCYAAKDEHFALKSLADGDEEASGLVELEGATDSRIVGEAGLLPGISIHELVFGIPAAWIINAAFTCAPPDGSRFNDSDRGAWYSAFTLKTCEAEVSFHKSKTLQEINWQEEETAAYVDCLADFRADFHDIRKDPVHADCLDPENYKASQALARDLLKQGSAGIVYPSVRHFEGTCLVCFRPALVTNIRWGDEVVFTFRGAFAVPVIEARGPLRKPVKREGPFA